MSDEQLPIPVVKPARKGGRPSAVWIVPMIALIAAGALAVKSYFSTGPTIRITFETADGIEGGKSEVRYKNVPVGTVVSVDLAKDRKHIVATVELTRGAAMLTAKDSQFWVERPRIGVGGVSGLGTLLSGAYIGVDVGVAKEESDEFTGLEKPPGVTHDQQGTRFKLTATDAGSLAPQSPVYVVHQNVGKVSALELAPDGKTVDMEVFIQAPYDKLVTTSTVFWNTSGLDVTLDASGLRVSTPSLASVVAGGVEFGTRPSDPPTPPAPENQRFVLFEDHHHAMAIPDREPLVVEMRFDEPFRGNGAGVNVEMLGVHIGDIGSISPGYDSATRTFFYDARAIVFPHRLGAAYDSLVEEGQRSGLSGPQVLQSLVARGLRAQMKSSNFLTGAYYIDLAFFPPKRNAPVVVEKPNVWVIPTEHGSSEQITDQVASILTKLDNIPFAEIGQDVGNTTRAASQLLGNLDRTVVPGVQNTLAQAGVAMGALRDSLTALRDNVAAPDSAIQQSVRTSLEQLDRAAYSLRGLADYLKSHPESLVRGRASGGEPKGSK
ncbi:MAG TPA: MlaD family protein [Kofleriaceae bacterium]|jgi:paraquat-inducible protein B